LRTIRPFLPADMDAVLRIWLEASIRAHDFVAPEFWEERVDAMRNEYLPASEVWVLEEFETIQGFCALHGDTLEALFVAPDAQGAGIGKELMQYVQSMRQRLELCVFSRNDISVAFYKRHDFTPVREQTDPHTGAAELVMEWNAPVAL